MKLDDVLTMEPPTTPEALRAIISEISTAEDLSEDERGSFGVGYILGLIYGLMDDQPGTATELLLRMREQEEA